MLHPRIPCRVYILACAYNDLVRLKTGKPAFEKLGLSDLRKALGIEGLHEHRALDDALDAAKVYKALLERMDLTAGGQSVDYKM